MEYKNLKEIKNSFLDYLKNNKNIDAKKDHLWEMNLINEWISKNVFFIYEEDIFKLVSKGIVKFENLDTLNKKNNGEIQISKLILKCLYENLRDSFYEDYSKPTKK